MKNRIKQRVDLLRWTGRLLKQINHWKLYFKKGFLITMGTLTWSGICHLMEINQQLMKDGINNYKL